MSSALPLGVIAATSTGCPYPVPLDIAADQDAGPGSAPVITASGPAPAFAFPGPLLLARTGNPEISLTVRDTDVEDTLYVRFFVDYDIPEGNLSPAQSDCIFPPNGGEVERVGQCAIDPICGAIDPADETNHFLEAMVADRDFLTESDRPPNQPLFRGLPPDASFSIRAWLVACEPGEQ